MERKTVRPTAELVGIWGGFQGKGKKTVLPALAHAKIVFRLVAGQSPEKVFTMLEEHLRDVAPLLTPGLNVTVQRLNNGARAFNVDRESLGYGLVKDVLTDLYGKEPAVARSGGSVNAYADFVEILGLNSISFGFGGMDSYLHAPDERFRIRDLHLGQQAYLKVITAAAEAYERKSSSSEADPHTEL